MVDRDDTLLPMTGWANVLEQLSLPLRAYQQQLMRTYEPALRLGEQFWHASGGWLRYWERFVYWEQLVAVEGSGFEVPDWRAEEGTSTTSTAITPGRGRPAVAMHGVGPDQLPEAGRTVRSGASRGAVKVVVPPDPDRVLADLAWVLEVVRAELEHLTASLNVMLAEQLRLLGEVVAHYQEGTPGHERQAGD
ncbi:MAG: hypothetical protein M3O70_25775 [Actinomycetota bacterium]|nr:hypothetical protein [Actinomycetota bacterium]